MTQASTFEAAYSSNMLPHKRRVPLVCMDIRLKGQLSHIWIYEDKVLILHFIANVHNRLQLPSLTIHGTRAVNFSSVQNSSLFPSSSPRS